MSDNQAKPEATPVEAPVEAPEATEAEQAEQQPQQPQLPPVAVHLPTPKNARTLPKPQEGESFSKLSLYSQPSETVQEIKLAVSEWVGGYWLGPHSLRLPGKGEDVLSTSKDGIEIRAGDKLSDFLELADVFAHLPEDGERTLDVVPEPYSESSARQAVIRLLEFIEPAGTTVNNLSTPLGVGAGASIFEEVRTGSLYAGDSPKDAEAKAKAAQKEAEKKDSNDAKDAEVTEHAFSDWTPASNGLPLSKLPVSQAPVEVNACLRSIQLSPFNPPPAPLRQKGHQLYLQVSILEGDVFTLVCTTRGWYVSKSNVNNFDPTPRDGSVTHSLFDLLHSLSPLFTERLFALPSLSSTAPARDPLSTVAIPQAEPAFPWIIAEPKPATGPEILRTQLAYLHSGATSAEGLDSARDWNEEIQGVKELPHSTMPERVFRERMAQKTWAEFTQASIRAAMNVARGDILPLNPNEPARQHMWLVSNIFVTKAVDSIGAYSHVGGDAAAHVSHAKDAEGVRLLNRLDIDGANVLGHTVVDWQGDRWICQSVLPGIFSRRDPEAEDEAETEPKDEEKKEDWVKVEGDKEEEPALNPLIIYGADSEQTTTLHWDEATHKVMQKIAAHQRLAPHKLQAGDKEYEFYASSEVKGLRGSDGRRYFLDLPRLSPVDIEWLEKNYEGKLVGPGAEQADAPVYPHRMTLLRPELIEIFWESELKLWAREITAKKQAEEAEKAKAEGEKSEKAEAKEGEEAKEQEKAEEKTDAIDPETIATLKDFELRFNPDAFVDSPSEDGQTFGPSKYTDESDPAIKSVRDASKFLRDMSIPAIVVDVLTGSASGVMDGASLTRIMHARGINMRYLGILAAAIDNFSKKPEGESKETQGLLGALRSVVIQEMVFRGAKHILRDLVRGLLPEQVPNAISHFLNCLLGTDYNASPKAVYEQFEVGPSAEPAYVSLTPESLRKQIVSEVETRFRWKLDEASLTSGLRKPQLLRELASRFAFQIAQRDYAFDASSEAAAVNGDSDKAVSKKKKGKSAGPSKRVTTFEPADVLTLLPVVMSTAPSVAVAEEIFEAGRATINRGDIDMGLEFMLEGVQLYESIHSVIHPEVAAVYHQYASTLHQLARIKIQQIAASENADPEQPLGLDIATALKLQRHAVLIAERTLGVYHHDTVAYYFQLAMLENLEGNAQAALRYFRHILMLWNVIYGADHPEINTLLSNAGIVLQSLNQHQLSIALLHEAAERNAAQFSRKHVQYGNALHQLTQAHFLGGDFAAALASSEGALAIFTDVYGAEHAQTKEVAKNVELLKAVIDNVERQKQEQELLRQQQASRLQAAQRGVPPPRKVLPGGTTLTAEQAAQLAASVRAAAAKQAEEAGAAGAAGEGEAPAGSIKIGERGHMDVDELVKYIQGAVPSNKPARGAKNLRGKRRTGAKR
ncbi:hypothetical protein CC85DRAFT_255915 [Cutaneotrichosporon oleaginosum]|uniref:Clustered mitochondria protein homolog n=1 Tax=Cutaneotrichosporon oleaginosum TaxID=879819 RepID=A0A0J0XVB9_9TREE|nr:uncharacterized protein CC85DRAFT_255915 [Cutaneotrichosporon oleaginosum]KLT45006.1 hypothetical protein CC85DRAFT_255915 [Cutaneotrichosporon oleaginosum]TXT09694.1 hypothetical protein COLE_03628 [Cutaneotrichosporon oleaginosum]